MLQNYIEASIKCFYYIMKYIYFFNVDMEQPIFDVCMPQNSISLEKMHIKLPMELGSKCFHQVMFIVYLLKVVNH